MCVKYVGNCRLYRSAAWRIYNEELNRNLQQKKLNKAWQQVTEGNFMAGETEKD
jgi:hypothetical protein